MVCVICLEELQPQLRSQESMVCRMNCGHEFHSKCIWQWVLTQRDSCMQCPSCRSELTCCHHFSSANLGSIATNCIRDFFRSTYQQDRENVGSQQPENDNNNGNNISPAVPVCLTPRILLTIIGSLRSEAEDHRTAMQEQRDMDYSLRVAQSFHMEDQRQIMMIALTNRVFGSRNLEESEEPVIESPSSLSGPAITERNSDDGRRVRPRPRSLSPTAGTIHPPSLLPFPVASESGTDSADLSGNVLNVQNTSDLANTRNRTGRAFNRNVRRRLLPPDIPGRRQRSSVSQRREDRVRAQHSFTRRSRTPPSPPLRLFVVSSSSDSDDGDSTSTVPSTLPLNNHQRQPPQHQQQGHEPQEEEKKQGDGPPSTSDSRTDSGDTRLFANILNLSNFMNRRTTGSERQ